MPKILIVANCPSENALKLQAATAHGCRFEKDIPVDLRVRIPWDSNAEDVIWSDGVIIGTTENFGYMSGAIKDFFERIYYPCLEVTEGKPVALYVKAGLDGQGAKTSVEKILVGLKWKLIQPPVILKGKYREDFVDQCETLGMTLAVGLDAGIY